jgi:dTDP-4-dehydrorhamnose reductase
MKVLLLGSTGMAGMALKKSLTKRGIKTIGVARSGSDISCDLADENQIANVLCAEEYDAFINAAAQVDVARCDKNPLESWNINARLVSFLSNFSHELDVPLLQISTDHYYTYGDDYPHKENDRVFCINEYSRHKYAAESFALISKNSLVLRTSILGARKGSQKSLVEWAIESLRRGAEIELFSDAWTSSLDVETFADVALTLLFDIKYRGLVNVGSRDVFSKEKLIRNLAEMLQIDHSKCLSGSIKRNFSNRPNCLGLDVSKVEEVLGHKMPTFDQVCQSLAANLQLDKSALN